MAVGCEPQIVQQKKFSGTEVTLLCSHFNLLAKGLSKKGGDCGPENAISPHSCVAPIFREAERPES